MSQSVVLICPLTATLAELGTALAKAWSADQIRCHRGRYEVEVASPKGGVHYASVGELMPVDAVRQEFLDNEDMPSEATACLADSRFFHIIYNDHAICSAVLQCILSAMPDRLETIWMDNDHAKFIRGDTVLAQLRADPAWEWRTYGRPE